MMEHLDLGVVTQSEVVDVPKPLEQFAPAVGASTDLDLEVSIVTRREQQWYFATNMAASTTELGRLPGTWPLEHSAMSPSVLTADEAEVPTRTRQPEQVAKHLPARPRVGPFALLYYNLRPCCGKPNLSTRCKQQGQMWFVS